MSAQTLTSIEAGQAMFMTVDQERLAQAGAENAERKRLLTKWRNEVAQMETRKRVLQMKISDAERDVVAGEKVIRRMAFKVEMEKLMQQPLRMEMVDDTSSC